MKPPQNLKLSADPAIPPNFEFIAKTIASDKDKKEKGVDVLTHCKIVGLVARELINRFPVWLSAELFPPGSELVAAVHDIGKISPGFQQKIYSALKQPLGLVNPNLDRNIGGHPAVSQAALHGVGKFIPQIAGNHHGYNPTSTGMPDDDKYGGKTWQEERWKTINELKRIFETNWPVVVSDVHAAALSGLTTVSDWIGSSRAFSAIKEDSALPQMVCQALDFAGFIQPKIRQGLSFEEVFPSYTPHPLQQQFIKAAAGSGVYVLEAPMGLGKTEAALFAAYQAMEKNQAAGIYFALPTQLTSNKMVERMNAFLDVILAADCPMRKALLLHGTAWLYHTKMGEDAEPGKSWFDNRKRGLLAPFAVGTVDQALMGVMNVKHGFVRTFGLAGKVVILDEIHTYDSYTGTIIDHLIKALRELHCTVIVLSATLTMERRTALISTPADKAKQPKAAYPLISAFPRQGSPTLIPGKASETASVSVHLCHDENLAIEEALARAARGEQVLWLENTVMNAQTCFKQIGARSANFNIDCGLLHSRFLKTDREINETQWVHLFGKHSADQRRTKGRILIGTQVLEQSLDIDGDFLISRICPSDMLLQRIGRLWRHRKNDTLRPKSAQREIWIISPTLEAALADKKNIGNTGLVYAPYVLCRTIEVWQNLSNIKLPEQMRELIEDTYRYRTEEAMMAHYQHQIEKKRETLSRLALVGIAKGGKTQPENTASTRYSETDSVEVLLFRSKQQDNDNVYVKLLDNSVLTLPHNIRYIRGKQWREKAATLLKNTVSVPEGKAPVFLNHTMGFLKHYVYLGEEAERPFRAALVKDSGELVGLGQHSALEEFRLRYDSTLGYSAEKIGANSY